MIAAFALKRKSPVYNINNTMITDQELKVKVEKLADSLIERTTAFLKASNNELATVGFLIATLTASGTPLNGPTQVLIFALVKQTNKQLKAEEHSFST